MASSVGLVSVNLKGSLFYRQETYILRGREVQAKRQFKTFNLNCLLAASEETAAIRSLVGHPCANNRSYCIGKRGLLFVC